ncbi:MAG: recombinase family protein [Planctomycetota bacterium]
MNTSRKGRGLFYHRDSGGKAEMTPAQYVEWARREAKEEVSFDGTPERIEAMIREGRFADGDLFLDYDVKGNLLSRPGLDALFREALGDPRVSHIFIPRRDRLARPDDPIDGVKLETRLRAAGKTLVFMKLTLPPLRKGQKADIAETITAVIEYDRSDEERIDLAQKILDAQVALARLGYSTGGRPPFGFRRWLAKEDGTRVRELAEGERVRMPGHHVVWLPTAEAELKVVRRILAMLETMPSSQVAARLTAEGIPSPNAGRLRKDRGIKHPVSGVWHQTTVVNIARNPLLVAVATYGLRSMGDKLRFTPSGPRPLEDRDFREDDKPKVIRNPESQRITAPARFEPLVDVGRHRQLLAVLDARGGTQRGKPRARDPKKNPLGGRIFDMNCGWPMYRSPYGKSFRYGCGYYQQSHGAECHHNHVPGPVATRFMLSCLQQRLLSPTLLPKMEQRFRELAAKAQDNRQSGRALAELRAELAGVQAELKTVSGNLARAKTAAQYDAISATFEELTSRKASLSARIAEEESRVRRTGDVETEVAAAVNLLHHLADLVADVDGLADSDRLDLAGQAFRLTNAQLFLRFQPVKVKKRVLNKVAGGVVTFGAAAPPVEIYRGPTGRRALNSTSPALVPDEVGTLALPKPPKSTISSGPEGKSLRNVNRGDWI